MTNRTRGLNSIAVLAFVLSTALALTAANALEIVCVQQSETAKHGRPDPPPASSCKKGLIRGTIEKGDYEHVLAFLRQNQNYRALGALLLQSPGGDA